MSLTSKFSRKFPPYFLEELCRKLALSNILGDYIRFDRRKSSAKQGKFWACCPFHQEKTPSFLCDDHKGFYYCFGCKETGNHISFLMKAKAMPFSEAVEYLAQKAGMALPAVDLQLEKQIQKRFQLYDIMDFSCQFFKANLDSEAGYKARDYLKKRGIDERSVVDFGLGYALDDKNALKEHLLGLGVTIKEMFACGLLVGQEETEIFYDRFRDRIMFPILDLQNHIVGFGGRALKDAALAKYLNSPKTEIFHKGSILYHLVDARKHLKNGIDEKKSLLVVEGYMDVLALTQYGFDYAVAPLGTALTEEQLELLWRYSAQPILCFDGDEAGIKAAYRVMNRALPFLNSDRSLRFVLLPQGMDPDEILRNKGATVFETYLQKAISLFELLWREVSEVKLSKDVEEKARLDAALQDKIKHIKDKTLAYYYRREARERLRQFFYQKSLEDRKKHGKGSKKFDKKVGLYLENSVALNIFLEKGDSIPLREATILVLLLRYPRLWSENFDKLEKIEFTHKQAHGLYEAMLDIVMVGLPENLENSDYIRQNLLKKGLGGCIEAIEKRAQASYMDYGVDDDPYKLAQETLKQTLSLHLAQSDGYKAKIRDIRNEIFNNLDEKSLAYYSELGNGVDEIGALEARIDDIKK